MDFRKYGLRSVRLGENKMKAVNKGFTLIELMIVVAVIGVLAAIAIPQYQNYVAKAELGSALSTLASLKTNVEDKLANDGAFPSGNLQDLGAPAPTNGTIEATTAAQTIVFSFTTGSEKVKTAKVTLTRNASTAAWTCTVSGGTGLSNTVVPKGCTYTS